jgi:VWFA-related protein
VFGTIHRQCTTVCLVTFLSCLISVGSQGQPQEQPKQEIPDAPSASRPPQPFPATPPTVQPGAPPANEEPPSETNPSKRTTLDADSPTATTPLAKTAAPDRSPERSGAQDELYKIVSNVNQVVVPVMVKDDSGRLINGLLPKDFSVYEDGIKQKLNFFSSDPLPLSAAVILDLGMPDIAVQKVNRTFPALEGAFSQFDEVSIYTYSSTVSKAKDFSTAGQKLTSVLNELKTKRGRNSGPPVLGGPLGPQGPSVNGRPIDPNEPIVITAPRESHVLNDAIVMAAMDLSKREPTRRKVIFVISDGREYGSDASYSDTLKILLSHGIQVYGVGVEGSAIPGYNKLQKLHIPRFGYSDILPKYANATGGEIFTEFSREAIESVYARALGDARNQYTLGYITRLTPSSTHREIEVRVARPDVKVTAREGYYPLPPSR